MEFLAYGTAWFWAFVAALSIIITWIVNSDEEEDDDNPVGWVALIALSIATGLAYFFGLKQEIRDLVKFVLTSPGFVAWVCLAYVAVGAVWSVVKWYFYLTNRRRLMSDSEVRGMYDEEGKLIDSKIPRASRHKALIMMWMTWWPASFAWTYVNDPIRRVFREVFARMERTFDGISRRVMSAR